MALVGFRAGITGFGGSGLQPCGQFPVYTALYFNHAYWDTSGRYDNAGMGWRPVLAGEAPRVITLGAQVTIMAGAANVGNPSFGVKLQKNGFGPSGTDIAAGQGHCDPGKSGWAHAQVTAPVIANPGDFFCVTVVASCWTAGQPPITFPSPWAPGSQPIYGPADYCAIDPNQFHTYFWGTDVMP